MIFNDSISDFWAGFCRAFKDFPVLVEQMQALGYPQDATAISVLAELLYDSFSTSKTPVFIIMDDLYFLQQKSLIAMLMFLARSLPGSFHWARECPEILWLNYPTAIVSSMVKMFSFHNIPEIMRMKTLLLKALEENNDLNGVERNNLRGDAEVSESFLRYNDISAMSIHIPRYSDAKYLL